MPTNSPSSPSQRAQSPSTAASTPIRGTLPENAGPVFARLLAKQLEAWRRNDGGADVVAREQLRSLQRDRHFGAGCDQRDVAAVLRIDHDISAERDQVPLAAGVTECRHRLPRQAQQRRASLRPQRAIPGLGGLDGIAGPEHQQIGNRAQRRQMLDRLMGRPVLAQSDGIMRHHMDDADAHQRRQPDRRPAVVGEG